jgi:hypothetical protein
MCNSCAKMQELTAIKMVLNNRQQQCCASSPCPSIRWRRSMPVQGEGGTRQWRSRGYRITAPCLTPLPCSLAVLRILRVQRRRSSSGRDDNAGPGERCEDADISASLELASPLLSSPSLRWLRWRARRWGGAHAGVCLMYGENARNGGNRTRAERPVPLPVCRCGAVPWKAVLEWFFQ